MTDEEFINRLNNFLKRLKLEIILCGDSEPIFMNYSIQYFIVDHVVSFNQALDCYYFQNLEEIIDNDKYNDTIFEIFKNDDILERDKYISLIKGNTKEEIILKLQMMGY